MFQVVALPLRIMARMYAAERHKQNAEAAQANKQVSAHKQNAGAGQPNTRVFAKHSETLVLTTEKLSPFEITLSRRQQRPLREILDLVTTGKNPIPSAEVLAPLLLEFFAAILRWLPPVDQGLNNSVFTPSYLEQFTAVSMVAADGQYRPPNHLSYIFYNEIRILFTALIIDAHKDVIGSLSELPSLEQLQVLLEERDKSSIQTTEESHSEAGLQLDEAVDSEADDDPYQYRELAGLEDVSEADAVEPQDDGAVFDSTWDILVLASAEESHSLLEKIFPTQKEELTGTDADGGSVVDSNMDKEAEYSVIPQPQDSAFARYVLL